MSTPTPRPRVIVVGAGISGLAAAHRVRELCEDQIEILVLEASERAGGVIRTEKSGDFLIECGPDSMVTEKPEAIALCERLGLEEELIPTQEEFRRTLIVRNGKLLPMPEGFQLMAPSKLIPFLTSPVLSPLGRITALKDLFLPRGGPPEGGDESLASFVRRRLGDEVLESIAQPMVGGIYTADPEKLSLASTIPRFLEMEREHRSILLGLAARARKAPAEVASGPRYGIFSALRGGIGVLVEALVNRLPTNSLRHGASVQSILPQKGESGSRWSVVLTTGDVEEADAVILAVPAPRASSILAPLDADISRELACIEYASSATVSLAYRKSDFPRDPTAFGFVVPYREGRKIIAGSFSHHKFAGRAPEDHALLRIFVGGALQPEVLNLEDGALLETVRNELASLLGVRSEPILSKIQRWPQAMPQYEVHHANRVTQISELAQKHPGLELAGNAYHGVGLADCVRSGEAASERILAHLGTRGGQDRKPDQRSS